MKKNNSNINMILINGLILGIIGILLLLTPLTTDVPSNQLWLDIIAGGFLVIVGLMCLVFELKIKKAKNNEQ